MKQFHQKLNTAKNQNTLKTKKSGNLFQGRFDKKVTLKGKTDWKHDPSGEDLEIIKD